MRALIQRVSEASVKIDGEIVGNIGQGILVLLGVQQNDSTELADKLLHKVNHYRIFSDGAGKMNLSVKDVQGGLLVVSQFTLAAETKKGLRPGFSQAAAPEMANELYEYFVAEARKEKALSAVETGRFGADMRVSLVNDGPVTFLLEV